jgi:Transposase DDE domain
MANKQLTLNGLEVWQIMAIIDHSTELHRRFFAPLGPCLEASPNQRKCQEYSDMDFLEVGVSRVLMACQSGRDLLQRLTLMREGTPGRSNFFESLKSGRRLRMVEDVAERLRRKCAGELPDALAQFPELDDFDVYAGDGHSHEHACHDQPVNDGRLCVTHLYARNLRNGWMSHLSLCAVKEQGNHHDMAVLKSLPHAVLRQGAKKRRKVIYAYDRAAIDIEHWAKWKRTSGIYFVSRTKATLVLSIHECRKFDHTSEINTNVLSDETVTAATSTHLLRRIIFWDVLENVRYEFLTNEMTLPPGLIVHLYRMRWDIEKSFDEFKNKLQETKAWATSENAKCLQAQLICLAENLLLLLRLHLDTHENVRNEAEIKRREDRLELAISHVHRNGGSLPLPLRKLQNLTQNSVKFIRWVATLLYLRVPWNRAVNQLRASYACL